MVLLLFIVTVSQNSYFSIIKTRSAGIFLPSGLQILWGSHGHFPTSIYLLKVNNRNTRTGCELYSKLTIKTPERRHWPHLPVTYLLRVNNRNIRTRCEICSKLTIKTPEQRHLRYFDVFIVNFEHISELVLVFLSLTLRR